MGRAKRRAQVTGAYCVNGVEGFVSDVRETDESR